MYLYLFVPVLCIRGLKMGWAMGRVWVWVWVWDVGCGMLVLMLMLHFGVPGATASFVCATLLDSRIACLVFRAIYVQPVPSG